MHGILKIIILRQVSWNILLSISKHLDHEMLTCTITCQNLSGHTFHEAQALMLLNQLSDILEPLIFRNLHILVPKRLVWSILPLHCKFRNQKTSYFIWVQHNNLISRLRHLMLESQITQILQLPKYSKMYVPHIITILKVTNTTCNVQCIGI